MTETLSVSLAPGMRPGKSNGSIKRVKPINEDTPSEFPGAEFGALVRGKYAARYAIATNVVVIDPALSESFPNAEAVNGGLRELLRARELMSQIFAPAIPSPSVTVAPARPALRKQAIR